MMKTRIFLTVSIVLLLTLISTKAVPMNALPAQSANWSPIASFWQIECVICPNESDFDLTVFPPSLALDTIGQPHLSFNTLKTSDDEEKLKYAWRDGEIWHIETVDSQPDLKAFISLALDEQNQPHIAYCDWGGNQELKYAHRIGDTWEFETVDSERYAGWYNSLAVDRQGRPHISYQIWNLQGSALKYAWHDGIYWHIEAVERNENSAITGQYTSLALDGAGQPHISYHSEGDLKYAWHDGTTWHIETVDGGEFHKDEISLALDGADLPHISYFHDNKLKYAWHDGAIWHIEQIDVVNVIFDNSLALDPRGQAHIIYVDASTQNIKHAWHGEKGWSIEVIDDVGENGAFVSLAVDQAGLPHVGYQHTHHTGDYLKYARGLPLIILDKQATPSDDLRNNEALTYTLTLSGPGLDVRLWDPLPPTVHYISSNLTGTLSPPAVYSPTAHAVVWQGTLPTDTVGVVSFQVTPGITGTGSLDLSAPIINTAWLTDTESGRSVSATVIVNGWRVYLPLTARSD